MLKNNHYGYTVSKKINKIMCSVTFPSSAAIAYIYLFIIKSYNKAEAKAKKQHSCQVIYNAAKFISR